MRIVLALTLFLVACASSDPVPQKKIDDKAEKKEMGFRFLPPQGKDWSVFNAMGFKGFSYGKKLPNVDPKNHSVIFSVVYGFIEGNFRNADDTLKYAKSNKEAQLKNTRFVLKKNFSKNIVYKSAKCLEFNSVVIDQSTNQHTTLNGMFCLHPQDHRRYIDLSHSQRFDINRTKIEIPAEEFQFIKSLHFLPL